MNNNERVMSDEELKYIETQKKIAQAIQDAKNRAEQRSQPKQIVIEEKNEEPHFVPKQQITNELSMDYVLDVVEKYLQTNQDKADAIVKSAPISTKETRKAIKPIYNEQIIFNRKLRDLVTKNVKLKLTCSRYIATK